MMNMKNKFCSELSRAKGLGAAGSGTYHWWHQRITALILALMGFWVFCFSWSVANQELSKIVNVIQKPYNIVMLALFILIGFYHAGLGMQVVIEDYIACRAIRLIFLLFMQIFLLFTVVSFLVAVLYVMHL